MEDLSYPIGKYIEQPFSQPQLEEWLLDIEILPKALEYAITNLDAAQLEIPYRPNGWNSRQVIHHVADSHMNAFMRFKLGLTEDNPTIKPYDQDAFILLNDVQNTPINVSITLLYALHARMYEVLKSITEQQWKRTVVHPQYGKQMTLWYLLGSYAWHGKHHTAHINKLRERMGWTSFIFTVSIFACKHIGSFFYLYLHDCHNTKPPHTKKNCCTICCVVYHKNSCLPAH